MTVFTSESGRKAAIAKTSYERVSRSWYIGRLKAIALGEKVTRDQLIALTTIGKANGWNRAPKRRASKRMTRTELPLVSPELAERLMG